MRALLAAVVLLGACAEGIDEQWELRHDRIIAVRANPPGILPGETSTIDALIGSKEASPVEAPPEGATVISPMSLAGIVRPDSGAWVVTAPDEAKLAVAREELGLEPGAPVPLTVGVSYRQQTLLGFKTVYLGEARQNPVLEDMMIAGAVAPSGQTQLVVPILTDIPLSVKGEDPDVVNWLTSCGTMHDFDLPKAYLRVEKEDPMEGDLGVVLRKADGGVAWRVWPIRAE